MKIGSFSLIKELNTSLILNTIRERKSISRAEIAKITGLMDKLGISLIQNSVS